MLTFIFAVIMLFIIPGPAVLLTISQTARGGKKVGIITGIGIALGDLIHTVAAVLGLSAVLMSSALAFEVVKYLGAAYLIYLGIRTLLDKSTKDNHSNPIKNHPVLSFRQIVLIELLNPKTALFFLAFLPQFVTNGGLPVVIQLLILGLTFVLMSILYTTSLVLLSSSIGNRLSRNDGILSRWQGKIIGSIYITLGLKLALQNQK